MAGAVSSPARGWQIAFLLCTGAGIPLDRGGLSGGRAGIGADAAVLAFLPLSCGRHPPGRGPVRCLCVSNLHAERFRVAFAVEAALAARNPGHYTPDEAGVAGTGLGHATEGVG